MGRETESLLQGVVFHIAVLQRRIVHAIDGLNSVSVGVTETFECGVSVSPSQQCTEACFAVPHCQMKAKQGPFESS